MVAAVACPATAQPAPRVLTTRNGRFAAFRQPDGIHVVDVLGPTPHRRLPLGARDPIAVTDHALWRATDRIVTHAVFGDDREPRVVFESASRVHRLVPVVDGVLVECDRHSSLVHRDGAIESVDDLDGATVLCASGRTIVEMRDGAILLRTLGRAGTVLLATGTGLGASFVFGRAIAIWLRAATDALVVVTTAGKLIHHISVPRLDTCAFAEQAGLAVAMTKTELLALDLRAGQRRSSAPSPHLHDLAIDASGRHVVVALPAGDDWCTINAVPFSELFRERATPASQLDVPAGGEDLAEEPKPETASPSTVCEELKPERAGCADILPLAFAARLRPSPPAPELGVVPYADGTAHMSALLDVVAARAALAVAEAWHSGRASHDIAGGLPHEHEVLGLVGEDVGLAADALRRARTRLADRSAELAARTHASVAVGVALPFVEIGHELELSATAMQILACAAAPALRGSIARLYGIAAGLAGRSACTEHLLELLVERDPRVDGLAGIARELAPDSMLVRTGLVTLEASPDRTVLAVDGVVLDRLRGITRAVEISAVSTRCWADRDLEDVVVPLDIKLALGRALADRDTARPPRVVVRGRRGAGRHTLIAALAERVGRSIAQIDAARIPRGPRFARSLAIELARANLTGAVPVVSGLENTGTDEEVRIAIEDVLRRHPGPIVLRASPDGELPVEPDRVEVMIPPLSLAERSSTWRRAIEARCLPIPDAEGLELLAARFRFGPGTIERIADQVQRRAGGEPSILATIDDLARHYIAGRLERVATRVTRLASWDQVTLVDEMRDSVRELIGRMTHQRQVYEEWGYDRRLTTARGLTALFYGPPGTGKTLVAGLIGRELGLDVWRIDLSRVVSKWIGETEKSLAEVFAAAEEGQVMLLFDEADSLFGKRSEVKSSNDRYANLETNYLLQRLDSFEGVAILTTNLDGSIDPAFKRRLSMRLYFPFPDEDQRTELWAAHVPPDVPCAGPLDFAELARRYPLSGGYIRNSALRAAFLAAQERRPLTQDHLVRAVQLEYRELGKLSSSGRME